MSQRDKAFGVVHHGAMDEEELWVWVLVANLAAFSVPGAASCPTHLTRRDGALKFFVFFFTSTHDFDSARFVKDVNRVVNTYKCNSLRIHGQHL